MWVGVTQHPPVDHPKDPVQGFFFGWDETQDHIPWVEFLFFFSPPPSCLANPFTLTYASFSFLVSLVFSFFFFLLESFFFFFFFWRACFLVFPFFFFSFGFWFLVLFVLFVSFNVFFSLFFVFCSRRRVQIDSWYRWWWQQQQSRGEKIQ